MENKTFGELDIRFKNTGLENEIFFFWNDEGIEEEQFSKIKEGAYKLVNIYDKFKNDIELTYPAYYVKGKNGPYYKSICFQPEDFKDCDYSYYEGVYVSCGVGYYNFYIDGSEIYNNETIRKLVKLNPKEEEFLELIKELK